MGKFTFTEVEANEIAKFMVEMLPRRSGRTTKARTWVPEGGWQCSASTATKSSRRAVAVRC
jgi:hypothetical protein